MKPSPLPPRLLTSAQAAAYLGMGKTSFFIYLPTLELPRIKIRSPSGVESLRYDIKDLDACVDRLKEAAHV